MAAFLSNLPNPQHVKMGYKWNKESWNSRILDLEGALGTRPSPLFYKWEKDLRARETEWLIKGHIAKDGGILGWKLPEDLVLGQSNISSVLTGYLGMCGGFKIVDLFMLQIQKPSFSLNINIQFMS